MRISTPLLTAIACCFVLFSCTSSKDGYEEKGKNESTEREKEDGVDKAMEQDMMLTRDPNLGDVPSERLYDAFRYAEQLRNRGGIQSAIAGIGWQERGPSNIGGRTRALLIDANDPTGKKVWAGSVGGGLWKTNDITVATPVWMPVNNFWDNIAISTIAQDPSNPQIIYVGTGEAVFNADAIRGIGIYKTTDGGVTWNLLTSTTNILTLNPAPTYNFDYVQKVVVANNGAVYAACRSQYGNRGGVLKSTDGGTTWTRVIGVAAATTALSSDLRGSDIEIASDGTLFASTGLQQFGRIWRSTTGDAGSWKVLNLKGAGSGLPDSNLIYRTDIALDPSNPSNVWIMACATNSILQNIYRSTNGGNTFVTLPRPTSTTGLGTDLTRGQAWYDLIISVNPFNGNEAMVGGVDMFRTTTAGASWVQVSEWRGAAGLPYVHADHHAILYDKNISGRVLFGNDGGVFVSLNGGTTYAKKDAGYNVTQYYGCAIHPAAGKNFFLAGAQDNGSQRFDQPGINATVDVSGGDGMLPHIDQDEPCFQFTSYVYNNYYRSTNEGASFTSVTPSGGLANLGSFVNPTDYDNYGNVLYGGCRANSFFRWNNPKTGNNANEITNAAAFGGGGVTSVNVSPNFSTDSNTVYIGTNNGRILKVTNSKAATPTITNISGPTGQLAVGNVSCVAIQKGNENHLIATFYNYGITSIWETNNGGTTWRSVEGNLPDMPVRWVIFSPRNTTDEALIATELGVWSTDNLSAATPVWGPSNSGLANVRTDQIKIRESDNMMIAATHGRGLFSSDYFSAPRAEFTQNIQVVYPGASVQFTDGSTKPTSWSWDVDNDGTIESTAANFSYTFTQPGYHTVKLKINNDNNLVSTKTDLVYVMPERSVSYTLADGGDFESAVDFVPAPATSGGNCGAASATTNWQRGRSTIAGKDSVISGANAWVTALTATQYQNNTTAILYTPEYNLSSTDAYTFSFYGKWKCEKDYDGFRIEYSTNAGATWTVLGGKSATWYNSLPLTAAGDFSAFGTNNDAYFTGTRPWAKYSYVANELKGQACVAFRFVFKSDAGVIDNGVALDNFELTGPANLPCPFSYSFAGSNYSTRNELTFVSNGERNVDRYELERANVNLPSAFARIRTMAATKNNVFAASATSYITNDDLNLIPDPVLYYRMKMFDKMGKFMYSNVVELKVVYPGFRIFPSLLQPGSPIRVYMDPGWFTTRNLSFNLFNAAGQLILSKPLTQWNSQIPLPALPRGMYMGVVYSNDRVFQHNKGNTVLYKQKLIL
ncbi:MAG: PKD domain-containing protein [Bacteroidota bacterium]